MRAEMAEGEVAARNPIREIFFGCWASAGKRRWGLVTTGSGQARMLGRTFARLIDNADRLDLRGVYWYAWRDTDRGQAVCGWCPWSGLLDRDGHRKPAYFELRDLWKNLVDAQ